MDDPDTDASGDACEGAAGREGLLETTCKWLCGAAIIVMLLVIGQDVISRGVWNTSLELSDEIGGYMLVAVAFLSLAAVKTQGAFQKTDYFRSRLPKRAQIASRMLFDLLALCVAMILLWQYFRYTSSRFAGGNTAPTRLGTPQWIPAVPMVLGIAAYVLAIVKSMLVNLRDLHSAGARRQG